MSHSDEFEFQGGAAAKTASVDGPDIGKNRDHAHNGIVMARKSLAFSVLQSFE
jgi:hypothetical protein